MKHCFHLFYWNVTRGRRDYNTDALQVDVILASIPPHSYRIPLIEKYANVLIDSKLNVAKYNKGGRRTLTSDALGRMLIRDKIMWEKDSQTKCQESKRQL